jgi:hypothetical protein
MAYTNYGDLPISVGAWLAKDNYDHNPDVVSVTAFIKPIRELILSQRVPKGSTQDPDIMDMLKSRIGTAIHESIERVWQDDNYVEPMKLLGLPQKVIDKITVNAELIKAGQVPMYSEHTMYKEIDGYEFRGTADFILNGQLQDFKTTSTYSYTSRLKDIKYALQGGIYRYLDPSVITQDHLEIIEIYLDWSAIKAKVSAQGTYPPYPIIVKKIPLTPILETGRFIKGRIKLIEDLYDAPQEELPLCTDDELWRKDPTYKYFKNPNNQRSTKNFSDYDEALAFKAAQGHVGEIRIEPSKATACKFCSAATVCTQAMDLIKKGELDI